jgi:hypothetical protein
MDYHAEIGRIECGAGDRSSIPGIGTVRFVVFCGHNAAEILDRAKEVLLAVLKAKNPDFGDPAYWTTRLPEWFVDSCDPEPSLEEAERMRQRWVSLPLEMRLKEDASPGWTVMGWVYWFEPDNRSWFWWDAAILAEDAIAVAVAVETWPFPWGALDWLFRACGATKVVPEGETA